MGSGTVLKISAAVQKEIAKWAENAYPFEGCGLLIGQFEPAGIKRVLRLAPLTNNLLNKVIDDASTLPKERQGSGKGQTEFVFDPAEFHRESLKAEKENLDVVGIIHTHPDHPPRPSQVDAAQPFLAQWSNVIVAVHGGHFLEMKSWFRDTDDKPFEEEIVGIF